jgi:hypothetical protein
MRRSPLAPAIGASICRWQWSRKGAVVIPQSKDEWGVVLASSVAFQIAFGLVFLLTLPLAVLDLIDDDVWVGGTWPTVWLCSGMAVVAALIAIVVVYRVLREHYESYPATLPDGALLGRRVCLLGVTGVALIVVAFLAFDWLVDVLGIPPEVIEELAK